MPSLLSQGPRSRMLAAEKGEIMSAEVLEAQKWLNSTYGGRAGYQRVEETGLPGSATSAALVSALQIELGMSTVTGVFGE